MAQAKSDSVHACSPDLAEQAYLPLMCQLQLRQIIQTI